MFRVLLIIKPLFIIRKKQSTVFVNVYYHYTKPIIIIIFTITIIIIFIKLFYLF